MAINLLFIAATLVLQTNGKTVRSPTPPMGWNSYNTYNCDPNEAIIHQNAQGLVNLGLDRLGYHSVTVDCGWTARDRDAYNKIQWNTTLFPSGPVALGDFLHGLGLDFGLYSDGGFYQCGSTDVPGSLGNEQLDAETFASWGGDSLKYDNCYASSKTIAADGTSAEAQSPARFQNMAAELDAVNRDFKYFICQWGVGTDIGDWAARIANTWRISNDIYDKWRSIWRITNQVVPYYKHTTVGAFPDMDMLIVGLGALSAEEERFHFGMWAINKSPLVLGAVMDKAKLTGSSLATMSNKDVIAINQDVLAKQAQLVRRYTVEEWDVWMGDLTGSRKVMGIANWKNDTQTVSINLASLGIASAGARDIWSAKELGTISGTQTVTLAGHELRLWVLSNIKTAPALKSTSYQSASKATLSGSAAVVACATGTCLPIGSKIGNTGPGASVRFTGVSAQSAGTKVVGIDFINYDYAFATSWEFGDNTRNMTIAVNGGSAKRWAFPLSGGDWQETGRLLVEVDGFVKGSNNVVTFSGYPTGWAPDLVGFEVLE